MLGRGGRYGLKRRLNKCSKKEQVVETTCGSHEKTSMSNCLRIRGSCPLENNYLPGINLNGRLDCKDNALSTTFIDKLTKPRKKMHERRN